MTEPTGRRMKSSTLHDVTPTFAHLLEGLTASFIGHPTSTLERLLHARHCFYRSQVVVDSQVLEFVRSFLEHISEYESMHRPPPSKLRRKRDEHSNNHRESHSSCRCCFLSLSASNWSRSLCHYGHALREITFSRPDGREPAVV